MDETNKALRLRGLLQDLDRLVADPARPEGELARWRAAMDLALEQSRPALSPAERAGLILLAREGLLRVEERRRSVEREKRALLVRLLACQAARQTLESYRRPEGRSFFNRMA